MNKITGNMESILDQQISGFHQYSLQPPVHLTYVSSNMCRMLGCEQEELLSEYADLYGQMIHPEDREVYDRTLKQLAQAEQNMKMQYRIVLKDGSIRYIRDDITSAREEDGTISAVSVLTDVTDEERDGDNMNMINENLGFLRYTCDKHPKVTYFNDEMLRILRFPEDDDLDQLEMYKENVYMMIPPEQRRKFSIFLKRVYSQKSPVSGELVVQRCDGTRARLQGWVSKCINEHGEEEFRTVCMDITDGITAFQVDGDMIRPLYDSDNICGFFGYSKDEWADMTMSSHTVKDFTARSGVPYEDFMKLLREGEAEFTYMDLESGTKQQIRAVCAEMISGDPDSRYVTLYKEKREPVTAEKTDAETEQSVISIRTFGYFDVFVDGNPIAFRNKKSKELLALLVDRRGGFVNSEEAISFLWEDEPVSAVTQARYRKVAMRLKNILEEYGIADIIETVDGKRRVVAERVQCDLYDYLSHKEEYAHLFKGSYLTNYSWGEITLGELCSESI